MPDEFESSGAPIFFLGGTRNSSKWRDRLMEMLDPSIECCDPRVAYWDEDARRSEEHQRVAATHGVYVLTPLMEGSYSIVQLTTEALTRPEKVVFCILDEDEGLRFAERKLRNLTITSNMWIKSGMKQLASLDEIRDWMESLTPVEHE